MKRAAILFLSAIAVTGALGVPGFRAKEAKACFNTLMVDHKCYCMPGTDHATCKVEKDLPVLGQICVSSIEACNQRPILTSFDPNGSICGYKCGSFGYF